MLINRGITQPSDARSFLDPCATELASPFDLPQMDRAVSSLARAAREQTPTVVYGDYDADGACATAILVRGLRWVGLDAAFYIPDRFAEGYGLHADAISRLAAAGARLVVAVDCGTGALAAADAARAAGVDLVILDHHEPLASVPPAVALVNPKVRSHADAAASTPDYCAAGLAYQACRALYQVLGRADLPEDLIELAAVATVADAVRLEGDNRALVARGLRSLARPINPGLAVLAEVAGLAGRARERDLSFALAPRLNAAGRLAHAGQAVRLLIEDDPGRCRELADDLDRLNRERRALGDRVLAEAVALIEAGGLGREPALVLASADWHPGVIGIVASQLVERYYRPTVLLAVAGGVARGSARSIPGLHLVETLAASAQDLLAFGGHAMAAGLTVPTGAVDRFRARFLEAAAARLSPEDLIPTLEADGEVSLGELTPVLVTEFERLAPFGPGNGPPLLMARDLEVVGTRLVGDGAHLRLTLSDGSRTAEAVAFSAGEAVDVLAVARAPIDLAFTVDLDRWGDPPEVRLVVEDLRGSGGDQAAPIESDALVGGAARLVDRLFTGAWDDLEDVLGGEERERGSPPATWPVGPAALGRVVHSVFRGRAPSGLQQEVADRLTSGGRLCARFPPGRGLAGGLLLAAAALAASGRLPVAVVFPRVWSAEAWASLAQTVLHRLNIRVGVVHGLTPAEPAAGVLERWARGDVGLLVTSAVRALHHTLPAAAVIAVADALTTPGELAALHAAYGSRLRLVAGPVHGALMVEAAALGLERTATDPPPPSGLRLVDRRGRAGDTLWDPLEGGRTTMVLAVAPGAKASVVVAHRLREAIPALAGRIAYHHADLPVPIRHALESLFWASRIAVLVTGSWPAGPALPPDLRRIVALGLPPERLLAADLLAGPEGAGEGLVVELAYGEAVLGSLEADLEALTPSRRSLIKCYHSFKNAGAMSGPSQDIAAGARASSHLPPAVFDAALEVLLEAGVVRREGGDGRGSRYTLAAPAERADLGLSPRHQEGERARAALADLRRWALGPAMAILEELARP